MGMTTLSIDDATKARFDDLRPDECRSADEFVAMLLDHYDDVAVVDPDVDDIEAELSTLDIGADVETLDYDDVKNACAQAIRDELGGQR